MAPSGGACLAVCFQLLQGVLTDGLQQPEARLPVGRISGAHQAAVYERSDAVQYLNVQVAVGIADLLGRLQREPTDERSKPSEKHLFGRPEKIVAPGDCVPECLLAGRQIA